MFNSDFSKWWNVHAEGRECRRKETNTTVLSVIALCLYSKTYLHIYRYSTYSCIHCNFHSNSQTLQMETILFCGWLKWVASQKITVINLSHITVSLPGMAHPLWGYLGTCPPPKARKYAMMVKFVDKLSFMGWALTVWNYEALSRSSVWHTGNLILVWCETSVKCKI